MPKETLIIQDGQRPVELRLTEVDFLRLCCQDIPYWQIAMRMKKSPRTINGYRDELFIKLQVRSWTGFVLGCFKVGFLKRKDIQLTGHIKKKRR